MLPMRTATNSCPKFAFEVTEQIDLLKFNVETATTSCQLLHLEILDKTFVCVSCCQVMLFLSASMLDAAVIAVQSFT